MSLVIRVLLLAGIGWLIYREYKRWQLRQQQNQPPRDHLETISRCSGCGLYLPSQSLSPDQRCGACERDKS